jgi:cytochrome b6-f complex iron-sulfur subunit
MPDKKKMSVADILAAARSSDAKGSAGSSGAAIGADAAEPAAAVEPQPAAAKPAAAKAAPASAGGGRPSVADILASARANKAAGGEAAAPAGGEPKPKPAAAKPAAAKAAPKPAAATPVVAKTGPRAGVERDTASILAAARGAAKPGPVSKAEAPPRPVARPKPAAAGSSVGGLTQPAPARTAPPKPVRPAKPAAKDSSAAKGKDGEDRRGFLEIAMGSFMAVGFTALSVTGGLFTLGLARFLFPNVLAEPPSRFKVGFKEGFPAGKVETKFVAQYGVWVVNGEFEGLQQIYALKTVCTHLGCTPNWLEAEQKFKCPCHGSGFYKDGINFEGPAPRPLERYAIRVSDDGQLEVDKSRFFQEELGQWADPESFVTA